MIEPVPNLPSTRQGRGLIVAITGVALCLGIGALAFTALNPRRVPSDPPAEGSPTPPSAQPSQAATGYVTAPNFIVPDASLAVPDLTFVDRTGETHKLSDFRGRAVLLNVWAIWCVPCRQELPGLTNLAIFTSTASGTVTKLGLPGLPGTLLIDRNGNEITRKPGPLGWDEEEVVDSLRQQLALGAPDDRNAT